MRLDLGGIARQGRHERAQVLALLEQHDAPVRQDALHFVTLANDLPPAAFHPVERQDPLAAAAVRVAVNDVQPFGSALEQVHERAAIVELLHGAVHLVEPRTRFLRRGVGGRDDREQHERKTQRARHRHSAGRRTDAGSMTASGSRSDAPTTFECTDVRLSRDAYSPWCMR